MSFTLVCKPVASLSSQTRDRCSKKKNWRGQPLNFKNRENMESLDYYDILQVPPNADNQMIKQHYRKLQKQYHPDCFGDEEMCILLNMAYVVLSDEQERKKYDQQKLQISTLELLEQEEHETIAPDVQIFSLDARSSGRNISEILDWIQQWCDSISLDKDLFFPTVLQALPVADGARLYFYQQEPISNSLKSVGEFLFKVKPSDDTAAIEIWRRVWDERGRNHLPGEKVVLKAVKKAFKCIC